MIDRYSKIGLGTVQFGLNYGVSNIQGQTDISEVGKILSTAYQNEVNLIDTASAYGDAESILGQFNLKKFKVVSKFMPTRGLKLKVLLEQSLEKLNTDKLYAYLAHRPLSLLDNNSWEELKELKENGFVQKIGYSLNEPSELDTLLERGFPPDIIQVPFNYFDHRFEEQMRRLKSDGCEIHTRSTFLQGLFFIKSEKLNSFFDEVKPLLKKLQNEYVSLNKLLLNYVLGKEFIDKVIIGVENNDQLLQNLNVFQESEELPDVNFDISSKILMPMHWPKKRFNE